MSAEMEIVFTDLLHLGGMKQAMRNTRRSEGRVPVFFQKNPRVSGLLPFVTVSSTLQVSMVISSADRTD